MLVGRDLSALFARTPVQPREEILRVEGLCLRHPARAGDFVVREVSLRVQRGEILGVFGLMGAGRTELLETLFGLHPREAINAGVVLAPEDRRRDGLVLSLGLAANLSLACIGKVERHGLLDAARESDLAADFIKRLRIRTPAAGQLVRHLSGGNQQKIVLAKGLATEPKILLLDEPTRGIDINAKTEIYQLLDGLVADGLGVVLVSSELPEILALADRILVISEGRKTAEFSRAEANEENIMKAALPRN